MPFRDTDHPDVAPRPRREAGIPEVAVDVIVNSLPVGSCERFLEGLLLAPALDVTGDGPACIRGRAAAQVVQAGCPADERPQPFSGRSTQEAEMSASFTSVHMGTPCWRYGLFP